MALGLFFAYNLGEQLRKGVTAVISFLKTIQAGLRNNYKLTGCKMVGYFQDDDRENAMCKLFHLYKDKNEGRSGTDAFLDPTFRS